MTKFNFLLISLLFVLSSFKSTDKIVVDSDMSLKQALAGSSAPKEILDSMVIIDVKYMGYDNKLHKGQIIVNKLLKSDVEKMFDYMLLKKFPIKSVIPIVQFDWDDEKSMQANNTSSFCYRTVAGSKKLSLHSLGRAIDINPFNNPAVYGDGKISPKGAKYNKNAKGTITAKSNITLKFKEMGWVWGGDWISLKDYQHFQKEK